MGIGKYLVVGAVCLGFGFLCGTVFGGYSMATRNAYIKKVGDQQTLVVENNIGGKLPMIGDSEGQFKLLDNVSEERSNFEKKKMNDLRAKILSE